MELKVEQLKKALTDQKIYIDKVALKNEILKMVNTEVKDAKRVKVSDKENVHRLVRS